MGCDELDKEETPDECGKGTSRDSSRKFAPELSGKCNNQFFEAAVAAAAAAVAAAAAAAVAGAAVSMAVKLAVAVVVAVAE